MSFLDGVNAAAKEIEAQAIREAENFLEENLKRIAGGEPLILHYAPHEFFNIGGALIPALLKSFTVPYSLLINGRDHAIVRAGARPIRKVKPLEGQVYEAIRTNYLIEQLEKVNYKVYITTLFYPPVDIRIIGKFEWAIVAFRNPAS